MCREVLLAQLCVERCCCSIVCREVLLAQLCGERCCWLNCVARGVVGSIVCREVLLAQLCVRGVNCV